MQYTDSLRKAILFFFFKSQREMIKKTNWDHFQFKSNKTKNEFMWFKFFFFFLLRLLTHSLVQFCVCFFSSSPSFSILFSLAIVVVVVCVQIVCYFSSPFILNTTFELCVRRFNWMYLNQSRKKSDSSFYVYVIWIGMVFIQHFHLCIYWSFILCARPLSHAMNFFLFVLLLKKICFFFVHHFHYKKKKEEWLQPLYHLCIDVSLATLTLLFSFNICHLISRVFIFNSFKRICSGHYLRSLAFKWFQSKNFYLIPTD